MKFISVVFYPNNNRFVLLFFLHLRYDSRVKAMEIDEKPTDSMNNDVGGLDKQIEELIEAVVLPLTHKDRFKALGIKPPKGTPPVCCRGRRLLFGQEFAVLFGVVSLVGVHCQEPNEQPARLPPLAH
jgi:hypothetical protein